MLKIRTFILALSLFPILSLSWQLPNQAQTNSPSKGTAGSLSGGGPSRGTSGSLSGGGNNGLPLSLSPVVKILPTGLLVISQQIQIILNRAAHKITLDFRGDNSSIIVLILRGIPGISNGNIQSLNIRLINLGAPRGRVDSLTKALFGLCRSAKQTSVPGLPVAQLPQEQLVASTKATKANFTIAQAADTQPSDNPIPSSDIQPDDVDINQLNDAIIAYNQIIQESSPVTLQRLSQDQDFVELGQALKELRAAVS
jgi:hypothetical protein